MKVLKAALLAGAALFATMGSSYAVTMTASGGDFTLNSATDYEKQIGLFSKFNGNAGTLTGVTFTVSYGYSSTITVSAGASDSYGSASTNSAAMFESSDTAIQSVLNSIVNVAGTARMAGRTLTPAAYIESGTITDYSLAANTSSNPFVSTASGSNVYNIGSTQTDLLAAFIAGNGTPVFDAYGKTLTATVLSQGGGNASSTQVTNATQRIAVLYTYETADPVAVPEPASIALLGLGLVGVGAIRRKFS